MKEVKKVSISGVSFIFDSDAFLRMEEYLSTLDKAYKRTPDGDEIVADIEARIAELILTVQDHDKVVDTALVDSIISQMGSPEAIEGESAEGDFGSDAQPRIPRRLYRNHDGAKLGGVCSGLGTFFGIDPVWVRLALFLPLALTIILPGIPFLRFATGFMGQLFAMIVVVYILMWFAVPMARSPRQKLEMKGERISSSSISSQAASQPHNELTTRSVIAEIVYVLGRICLVALKVAAILIELVLILSVIAMIVGLFVVLFSNAPDLLTFDGINSGCGAWLGGFIGSPFVLRLIMITGLLVVLLPFALIAYLLAAFIFNFRVSRMASLVVFLAWICSVTVLTITSLNHRHEIRQGIEYIYENDPTGMRRVERIMKDMEINGSNITISGDTIRLRSEGNDSKEVSITPAGIEVRVPDERMRISISTRHDDDASDATIEQEDDRQLRAEE